MMNMNIKFLLIITLTTFLLFSTIPLSVNACEKSCRVGISKSFADAYTEQFASFYTELTTGINTFMFDNITFTDFAFTETDVEVIKTAMRTDIDQQITNLQGNLTSTFTSLIEEAIFVQKPAFLGQCQNPYRVDQPPVGERWPNDTCIKMDYICGNPPSICHFMDQIVKPRNVENVKNVTRIASAPNGLFETSLVYTVGNSSLTHGLADVDAIRFSELARPNIANQLSLFTTDVDANFCSNNNCEQYDEAIKYQLLGFP